jgi:hypothetical protein
MSVPRGNLKWHFGAVRTVFGPLAEVVGFRASAINFGLVPCPLQMPDVSLRSIEPPIAIVLDSVMR